MVKPSRRAVLGAFGLGAAAAAAVAVVKFSGPGGDVVQGRSRARPIRSDLELPKQVDVVVIGGGIVGASTAFYLAKLGAKVALCEKGAIAGEASGRAQGQVSSAGLDPSKLPLINLSKELWAGLNAEVQGETGYRRNGLLCPYVDEKDQADWQGWIKEAGEGAPGATLLSSRQANAMLPGTTRWRGAYYDPTDGGAEPTLAAPAIAEAVRAHGGHVLLPCAVRGYETSAGRISDVVTERGPIKTAAVVLAGGCWSTPFAENAGIRLPSADMFSSLVHVAAPGGPSGNFEVPDAIGRRHIDGTYSLGATSGRIPITPELLGNLWDFRHVILNPPWDVHPHFGRYFFAELGEPRRWKLTDVSPFERRRILQPADNTTLLKRVVRRMQTEFPSFAKLQVLETWSGALNVTPDNRPVISAYPGVDGLFLATGFTYGITMGPAAGKLMAELVTGRRPSLDLHAYRYGRYTDGSTLEFTR